MNVNTHTMASEDILYGKDYLMEIDTDTPITAERGLAYRAIVCEVSSNFNIQTEEIEISNGCDIGWSASVPKLSGFSFSGEWQAINPLTAEPDVASMNEVIGLAASRQQFWARRKLVDGNTGVEVYREGRVWISRYEDTATSEDPFTFTADFVGVGKPITSAGYTYIGVLHDSQDNLITKDDNLIIVKA